MVDRALDLAIVVPAFNEAGRIRPTLDAILQYGAGRGWRFEVLVVDDGSHDATSAVVQELARDHPPLRLIRNPVNHGKGYAVRSGVMSTDARRVLFTDADGATPIEEVERLWRALDAGAGMAIGSRALASTEVEVKARWYRRMMGRTFHMALKALVGVEFEDTQCGFKLFEGQVARALFGRSRIDGFAFDVELLMLAQHRGVPIAEVPVNWRHVPGSRINLLTDSLRMLRDVWRIRRLHPDRSE